MDDSSEWIEEWWKHIGPGPYHGGEPEGQAVMQTVGEVERPWKYDTGNGLVDMFPEDSMPLTDTLWTMSDGGVKDAGTYSAQAGYGYIIRTIRESKGWGHFGYTMSGRGMVEGNNLFMDSTRAEARGLLATMTRILSVIKVFPKVQMIDHATDNEAVVEIYAGLKGRSTTYGMKFNRLRRSSHYKAFGIKSDGCGRILRNDTRGYQSGMKMMFLTQWQIVLPR